jgi:hypothetical protein
MRTLGLLGFFCINFCALQGVAFRKVVVDPLFRSEGVGIGDVNKDGEMDILVGDFWYEGPKWIAHEIRTPRKPDRGGYTEAFAVYPDDYNQDGWLDVLVIPSHGKDAKWYENPKGAKGHWLERTAFRGTGNETRLYVDLFKDGKKVFLMGVEEQIAWVEVPKKEEVNRDWIVHPISDRFPNSSFPKGWPAHKFARGLGAADLNGDGLNDVLTYGGWWEHPDAGRNHQGKWTFHKVAFVDQGVANMYTWDGNLDGALDVLCTSAHGSGIFWCSRQVDGTFRQETFHKGLIHETQSANLVDINGDGKLDLVTGRRFFANGFRPEKASDPSPLYWFSLKATKGGPPEFIPQLIDDQSGVGAQFVTEDFNGDKLTDIVVSNRKGVFLFIQK